MLIYEGSDPQEQRSEEMDARPSHVKREVEESTRKIRNAMSYLQFRQGQFPESRKEEDGRNPENLG